MGSEAAKLGIFGMIGLLSAIAVNRSAAVYHDGLRTSMMELWTGAKTRAQLARYAYGISIGFVIAYALPYSLASGIIVMHLLFLGIDVIGVRLRSTIVAGVAGLAYAVVACGLVDLFTDLMRHLPMATTQTHLLWAPLVDSVPLIPIVAAGQQFGRRTGTVVGVLTAATWTGSYLAMHHDTSAQSAGLASGLVASAVAVTVLVVLAWRVPGGTPPHTKIFDPNIRRIRAHWAYLLPLAGLIAWAASEHWLAGEPVQVAMLGLGHPRGAAVVAIMGAIGYFPVLGMTGLLSGVWIQQGFPDWVLALGYLSGNPISAAIAGVAGMTLELLGLSRIGRILTRRPGITSLGNAMRDAFDIIPTLAALAGGVLAASSVAGPPGACAVIGACALNEAKGRPVLPVAVPVAAFVIVVLIAGVGRRVGLIG